MANIKNDNTKERLISATIKLLSTTDASQITARQIVAEANTNLAMINYCFKSKEELMNIAVQRLIADQAKDLKVKDRKSGSPKEQLKAMLYRLCDITVLYKNYSKITVPYILLQDDITHPFDILPFIKGHFGNKKTETECRVIAYQMISFMQLVFLRSEDFLKYSGINILDTEQRNNFIDTQVNLFLVD